MTHEQELELQNDLEFLRSRFNELNQEIKLPHSLHSDVLCHRLEQLGQEEGTTGQVRLFPWKKYAGLAACFVFVFTAMWVMNENGGSKSAPQLEEQGIVQYAAATAGTSAGLSNGVDAGIGAYDDEMIPEMADDAPEAEMADDAPEGIQSRGVMEKSLSESAQENQSTDIATCKASEMLPFETQAQAREQQPWGAYLPQWLPESLVYESGGLYEQKTLSVFYSGSAGQELLVSIFDYTEQDAAYLVDINQKECYDLRLYEVPYADSVPEQYWETIQNPLFRLEDFSEEQVAARILYQNEPGDEKFQGQFSLFLEEQGIVVQFNATRLSPAEMFQIVQSY